MLDADAYTFSDRIAIAALVVAVLTAFWTTFLHFQTQRREDRRREREQDPTGEFFTHGERFRHGWIHGGYALDDPRCREWRLTSITAKSPYGLVLALSYPDRNIGRGPNISTESKTQDVDICFDHLDSSKDKTGIDNSLFFRSKLFDLVGTKIEIEFLVIHPETKRRLKILTTARVPRGNGTIAGPA